MLNKIPFFLWDEHSLLFRPLSLSQAPRVPGNDLKIFLLDQERDSTKEPQQKMLHSRTNFK